VDPDAVLTLARLARVLERASGDLSLPQYRLLALVTSGEDRATRLAGRLALGKPTISATVDTLVERGFLERAAVAGDRRAVRLAVTPTGRTALEQAEESMCERLDGVLGRVADAALVDAAFAQLRAALDDRRAQLRSEHATASRTAAPESGKP
jgi:DNA-binding MarR family transcriptional regulator